MEDIFDTPTHPMEKLVVGKCYFPYEPLELSQFLVTRYHEEGKPITNLQLQTLLYLVQKRVIALCDERHVSLYREDFHLSKFGAYIPSVYYFFCHFGIIPLCLDFSTGIEHDWIIDVFNNEYDAMRKGFPKDRRFIMLEDPTIRECIEEGRETVPFKRIVEDTLDISIGGLHR